MSCLPLSRVANTSYPVSQLLSDLAQTLPSCLCRGDNDAFQTVHLYNKDQKPLKNPDDYSSFTKDVKTGELYWHDSAVRAKCAGLLIGTPLLTVGVIVWNAVALVYNIIVVVARIFQNVYNFVRCKEMHDAAFFPITGITQLPCIIYERVKGILAAPFYGVAMEVAALFGAVCKPNHGRKLIAMIEHSWRNGVSYEQDIKVEEAGKGETFYLGWCLQVRGKITYKEDGESLESPVSLEMNPDKASSAKRVHIEWVRPPHLSSDSSSSTQANPLTSS